jgi:hypothetical protein
MGIGGFGFMSRGRVRVMYNSIKGLVRDPQSFLRKVGGSLERQNMEQLIGKLGLGTNECVFITVTYRRNIHDATIRTERKTSI